MTQQVSIEHLQRLEHNVKRHYANANAQLEAYLIFRLPSSLLRIPPVLACVLISALVSVGVIFFVPNGTEIWLKLMGLIVPLFLTWNSLYEMQPVIPMNDEGELYNGGDDVAAAINPSNTAIPDDGQLQQPQQFPLQEVAQPNNPAYLFWAKYWLIFCLSIITDKFCRTMIALANSDEWYLSSTRLFNIHMFFLILPPWYYAQSLYSYLLEPILLLHFETIFETYQTTKQTFGTIAQDTLSTTTTAFRSVSKHALVGGIQTLTKQSSARWNIKLNNLCGGDGMDFSPLCATPLDGLLKLL